MRKASLDDTASPIKASLTSPSSSIFAASIRICLADFNIRYWFKPQTKFALVSQSQNNKNTNHFTSTTNSQWIFQPQIRRFARSYYFFVSNEKWAKRAFQKLFMHQNEKQRAIHNEKWESSGSKQLFCRNLTPFSEAAWMARERCKSGTFRHI